MMDKRPLPQPPLDKQAESQALTLYAIIDCAHFDKDFYQSLIQNPMLIAESLFMRTLDEESAEAGPLLVKLDSEQNQAFIEKLQEIEQQKPAVVWLWSDKNFLKLADNILKPLLYGELEDGQKALIRYYDPRCIKGMLEVLKENESSAKKLANIKAWAFKYNDKYSYLV
ncbi:DUF4123 domain-containing protein [Gilliamella apis]|uniref:DUF4123 domain-containing protein n=1 Tax=Gilliamella apis TaxID=1970738 RepID=A0A242NWR4_9GAMM|nr:DUF4123 domain-containing protein [Gilliamella apis]OTQ52722.1 hypothetical protein B6D06_01745 [Gilliamella apis]